MITVNGVELYHETRGHGPSVLLIPGATGDAGNFTAVAEALASEYTVLTYDRRGNSRSPRPPGWAATSMEEQANDAAALLHALGLAPATVFGTSGGASILLDLIVRHPQALRSAIIHEPPRLSCLPYGQQLLAERQREIEQTLASGGPRAAMALFLRWSVGEEVLSALDPALRERMLANGEVFLGLELGPMVDVVPDACQLRRSQVPIHVLAGADNRGTYLWESAEWVAELIGTRVEQISGGHTPYLDRPAKLAEELRSIVQACKPLTA